LSDPLIQLTAVLADRYQIERELGHGGMATVYLARDLKHHRAVAIKVLRPELAHVVGPERFLREIEIAARLQHPLILPVFDSGAEVSEDKSAGQVLWYAMPFIAGESLRDRINRERQLSVDEAVRIAGEVAQGLACAHAQAVVHRDIKPENILLSDSHAIIADFGIARALDATVSARLTETGLALGTPAYMSPEQAAAEAGIDGRSDIYAVGCVLYEMLAGQPPFTGSTAQSIRARHAVDPVPSLRSVRATVSRGLEEVIRRALAKVPADRFATADDFASALRSGRAADRSGRRARGPLLGVGIVAATAVMFLTIIRNSGNGAPRSTGEASIRSLAVQPFSNLTGDTAQLYLAQGLTDQLVTSLAQVNALRVINVKGREVTAQLVKQLGLDAVLTGSLQRAGNAVHISVDLSSVPNGQALWAQGYDGELSKILDLQAQVAKSVASKIGASMTPQESAKLTAERPAVNPAAYEAYVRGSYFQKKVTKADLHKAISYFQQAIEADPAYAAAWAGLAHCYNLLGYYSIESPASAFPHARDADLRAMAIDSLLGEAHGALAVNDFFYGWNFSAAELEFRRAIELDPKWAGGYSGYGLYLTAMNRTDDAIIELKRAQDLDPLTPIQNAAIARPYYNARRYAEAIAQSQKTLALDSTFHRAHYWLGLSYEQLSQPADAIRELEQTVALSPGSLYEGALGHAYAVAGQRTKALRVLGELQARSDSSYVSPFDIATIYAGLGDRTRMFQYLEKAYQERVPYLVYIAVDPHFDDFHSDPRFRDLVHRIGLPAGF
jgi:eukaryotic-like serine/threonine-protein kinase